MLNVTRERLCNSSHVTKHREDTMRHHEDQTGGLKSTKWFLPHQIKPSLFPPKYRKVLQKSVSLGEVHSFLSFTFVIGTKRNSTRVSE